MRCEGSAQNKVKHDNAEEELILAIKITTFDSESFSGYKQQTTFWMDFCIAEHFGPKAIRDTYKRAKSEWKKNVVYFTELVLIMNWKLWEHYENGEEATARLYDELWRDASNYAVTHFKGDDLSYYLRTTD